MRLRAARACSPASGILGVISGLARGLILLCVILAGAVPVTHGAALLERGEYLVRAGGCTNCHTDEQGAFLAGGRALNTPFGTFYAPNITPHRRHGIGAWTDAEFLRAMKAGLAPDGTNYYPAFPYVAYAGMRREDVLAVKAYLDSIPPVAQPNRPHQLPWYLRFRPGLWLWKWRYLSLPAPGTTRDTDPLRQRGAYLVNALAHCGECHTPRDWFGGLIDARRHAGTVNGPDGDVVPNITPDRKTGIGKWSNDDLLFYLQTGLTADGDSAGGPMAEVIDNITSRLTKADQQAIVRYVLSLPPIENSLQSSRAKTERDPYEY